jgi:hypothetical protein
VILGPLTSSHVMCVTPSKLCPRSSLRDYEFLVVGRSVASLDKKAWYAKRCAKEDFLSPQAQCPASLLGGWELRRAPSNKEGTGI